MKDFDEISREELIGHFNEEQVAHSEWWADQMGQVENVEQVVIEALKSYDWAKVMSRGWEVNKNGLHTLKFEVDVAGDPWEWGEQ